MNHIIEYTEGATLLIRIPTGKKRLPVEKGIHMEWRYCCRKKKAETKARWVHIIMEQPHISGYKLWRNLPLRLDRPHDISIVLMHKLDDKWDFSAEWVYGTGNAVTLATIKFPGPDGWEIQTFDKRNSYRAADYHGLMFRLHDQRKLNGAQLPGTSECVDVSTVKTHFIIISELIQEVAKL